MVDFKICPGPLHCEGCAGNAELTTLRAERDAGAKTLAEHRHVLRVHAEERDALRARVAELTRLGNEVARVAEIGPFDKRPAIEVWRKAVRG